MTSNSSTVQNCPDCGGKLVEQSEYKRDVTGTWGNRTFMYCNTCKKEVKDELGN